MSKDIQIIDNVLEKEQFKDIQALMLSLHFPWYYTSTVTNPDEKYNIYYFTHIFYKEYSKNSDFYNVLLPLIKVIKPNALIRIKGNMYPNVNKKIQNDFHIDYPYEHKTAIFYINTNNGPTVFKSGKKVQSKENRLLIFNNQHHASTYCTDQKVRVNININYF